MDAYHIYYQKSENEFEEINYLVQIASILFWKKNHGDINLYCNDIFLKNISKWGIDKLYKDVNISCLDNMPYPDYYSKYWSFCKIHAAKEIATTNSDFCILDTDLWIQEPINIDNEYKFIGYHPEQDLEHDMNPYINPKDIMGSDYKLFKWDILPINCAFIYLNSQILINEWYRWCVKVINNNKDNDIIRNSGDTIFIEQRLLPTIAHTMGMKLGTLIPNIYQPHIPADDLGTEWIPKIGFDEQNQYMSWNIKHVWGLKKMYNNIDIRNIVIDSVISSLDNYFPNWKLKYSDIYDKVLTYKVNSGLSSK